MKANENSNPLVCIANVETNEVLRILYSDAVTFLSKEKSLWRFTEKRIYKQYIDSKLEGSNIPAPVFYVGGKDEKGNITGYFVNVYVGHPSYRINHRKSSCNKAGKYRFQHIPNNVVITEDKDGNLVTDVKKARVIRHIK